MTGKLHVVKDSDPLCDILVNDALHYILLRQKIFDAPMKNWDGNETGNFFEEGGKCFWYFLTFIIVELSTDEPMQVTYTEVLFCDSLRLVYLLLY